MTFDPDIEDLVGGGKGGRHHRDSVERKLRESLKAQGKAPAHLDLGDVANGVTAAWLAAALRSSVGTVRVKLARCPSRRVGTLMVYDIGEAMTYLVKPQVDIAKYLKDLKKDDLPEVLRESYWSALLKRQQWEVNAKELWHTEDVMTVFGETFQAIKFAIQLWTDDMEREVAITPAQYAFLVKKTDELQAQIYEALVKKHGEKETPPSAGIHADTAPHEEQEDDFGGLV